MDAEWGAEVKGPTCPMDEVTSRVAGLARRGPSGGCAR